MGPRLPGTLPVEIAARAGGHFGYPVPGGTAIGFRSNGGSITAEPQPADNLGTARVILRAQSPVPPSGIVTVLAFARGMESFVDVDGNGVFETD